MGVGKKAVEHKVKKTADDALDNMGKVGDVVDKHVTTGPMDAMDDKVDKAKDDRDNRKKDRKRD